MNRRSFLSLLAAAPLLPQLEKIAHVLAPAAEPVAAPARRALLATAGDFHVQTYALPLSPVDGLGVVRAGGVQLFSAMPQRPFRTRRVVVPESCADFEILNVSAAGEPMLDEAVPGWLFSPLAYGTNLDFVPTAPGETIVMAVRNTSDREQPFHVCLMGDAICDGPPPRVPDLSPEEMAKIDAAVERGDYDDDDDEDDLDEEGFPF